MISINGTGQFVGAATDSPALGTPVPLEVDPDTFFLAWHKLADCPKPVGCPLCDPGATPPSRFTVPVRPCCGVLLGDEHDCADMGEDVFGDPIFWDLRKSEAA